MVQRVGIRLRSPGPFLCVLIGFLLLTSCARSLVPNVLMSNLPDANDACYICHMLFAEEGISGVHLKAGISCSACHGKSLEHMDDETFSTPPDTLYSRNAVDSFCRTCHSSHPNVPPEKLVGMWLEKNQRLMESKGGEQKVVCTDCHGSHRIARRER